MEERKAIQNPKVYCTECRLYVAADATPLQQPLCIAKAEVVGGPLQKEGDVKGIAIATERNRRNNCRYFKRHRWWLPTSKQRPAIIRMIAAAAPESSGDKPFPARKTPKKAPPAPTTDFVQEQIEAAFKVVVEHLEETLEPLARRLDKIEGTVYASIRPTQETATTAPREEKGPLPPYVRRNPFPLPLPRPVAPERPPGEDPDVINGPM